LGTGGGIAAAKGDALGHFTDAHMSDIGAVLLIFGMFAVALSRPRRGRNL